MSQVRADFAVPFYDHAAEYRTIKPDVDAAIVKVLEKGKLRDGEETQAFEEELAAYCGAEYAITAGSCYGAMFKALLALGIGSGDEVITVANTCIACTAAISHTGASIVWVDISESDYNIDAGKVEEKISSRTKAILVVHMYGHPADMDPLIEIARHKGLFVIEDAAIALGAEYKGKQVGTFGDIGCFSHAPSKILGNYGDGGSAITNDAAIAQKMQQLHIYDQEAKYINVDGRKIHAGFCFSNEGYHNRMFELSTAILRVKLRRLDGWIARRREIASIYNKLLCKLDVLLPCESKDVKHVYRNYTIRIKNRDVVRLRLAEMGFETGLHYAPPLHLQPVYAHLGYQQGSLPITETVSGELITLPIYPELSNEQIKSISQALEKASHDSDSFSL